MDIRKSGVGTADSKMASVNSSFRRKGIMMGVVSGLTYGIYSTLVSKASGYMPLVAAIGILAAPMVTCGLNDFFAGIWLTIYNIKTGRIKELGRSLGTFPGKMIVLGSLLGGPIANGAYLVGLANAGAYAIPISATCGLFGALFAWLFLKQKPTKRVAFGMLIVIVGAITINLVKPEAAPNFTLGIICAFIAAICWGLEGVISSYGGSLLDSDVAVNIRELISGLVILVIIIPVIKELPLLRDTFSAVTPIFWLIASGLSAAVSFLTWYKANSTVGTAIGMSLNVTYAFWGVFFSILFLGQKLTSTIVIGSVLIIIGAIIVTMNPLDLFRKEK